MPKPVFEQYRLSCETTASAAFSQTGSSGLKGLTLHKQLWLSQLHLFAKTKPPFALLALT